MKKTVLGLAHMILASFSFGAWNDHSVIKIIPASEPVSIAPAHAYTYYRFVLRQMKGTNNRQGDNTEYFQIGELALYGADGTRLNKGLTAQSPSAVSDLAVGSFWMHDSGTSQTWNSTCKDNGSKSFDGNLDTKLEGNVRHLKQEQSTMWGLIDMRLPAGTPAAVAYNIATANDTNGNQSRNPTAWAWFGSDDGENWDVLEMVDVSESAGYVTYANKTYFNGGKPIPFKRNVKTQSWIQPGAKLTVSGDTAIDSFLNFGKGVEISSGTTVSVGVGANDHVSLSGGGLNGAGSLAKTGSGLLEIAGVNSLGGSVSVKGGILRFVPVDAQVSFPFYRFNVRKLYGTNANKEFEWSELALYDSQGNRINLNLKKAGDHRTMGTGSDLLGAGCFNVTANSGHWYTPSTTDGSNSSDLLFDGDLTTKSYHKSFAPDPNDSSTWLRINMHVADGSAAVAAYNVGSGNDIQGYNVRQMVSWSLEGSPDGSTWYVLDEVNDNARTKLLNSQWFNDGKAYPIVCKAARAPEHAHQGLYYRVAFKRQSNGDLQASELALYDTYGNRLNLGLKKSGDYDTMSAAASAIASLEAGHFVYVKNGHENNDSDDAAERLFDGDLSTKRFFKSGNGYDLSKPETWPTYVMRLDADAAPVAAYNVATGNDDEKYDRLVNSWRIEASDDGVAWTVLADETGCALAKKKNLFYANGGMPIGIANGFLSLIPYSAKFSVANGAALELPTNQDDGIRRLAIDCLDAGTICNFKAADGMALELTNFKAFKSAYGTLKDAELPLTFSGAVDVENLATWQVTYDGKTCDCYKLTYADGKLSVSGGPGLVIFVR